jgi:hypothetical protein
MIIINLMIITLLICSVILLSGVKIMFNPKYARVIMSLFIMYTPFSSLIEGYKLGYTGISSIIISSIVFLLIFIWGYRRNKHIYSIHNVKQKDVINIIEGYLEIKNIKYEAREEEIYLPELYKTIFVNGLIETSLDCRDIKDMDFYNELVEKVRVGIKEIKRRYFPIEGMIYLILVGILYWIRTDFLVNFLK